MSGVASLEQDPSHGEQERDEACEHGAAFPAGEQRPTILIRSCQLCGHKPHACGERQVGDEVPQPAKRLKSGKRRDHRFDKQRSEENDRDGCWDAAGELAKRGAEYAVKHHQEDVPAEHGGDLILAEQQRSAEVSVPTGQQMAMAITAAAADTPATTSSLAASKADLCGMAVRVGRIVPYRYS